jgi:hypothetical protein
MGVVRGTSPRGCGRAATVTVSASICNRTFTHMRCDAKRFERGLKPEGGSRGEAGTSGLSPQLPHPLNLPPALPLLGARGTYEGHSQRIRDKFCAHLPSNPSHSARHRTHRPLGSLRGGIPRPAAPLLHPIRKGVLRPVSILRNAICFPHPSVVFSRFLSRLTHTPGCCR